MNKEVYELLKTLENLIRVSNTEEQADFYHKQIALLLSPTIMIKSDHMKTKCKE